MRKGSGTARRDLIAAATREFRAGGYAGTGIEALCEAAGVSKGAFFHHFAGKEDLAAAAVAEFQAFADSAFAAADFHAHADPVERLLGYIDLRIQLIAGELPEFTCLLGTIVQEAYLTHPRLVAFCGDNMWAQMQGFEADIAAAIESRRLAAEWSPLSLSEHIQSVIQGGFVLAKAKNDPQVAIGCLRHLRRYIELLFSAGD